MLECGLTRGGFYAHFKNKAHLYEEALGGGHLAKLANAPIDSSLEWLRRVFAACSGDAPATSEWAFLATDVASAEPEIRESYLRAVDTMRQKLAEHLQTESADASDELALASAAMLIGALAISSSVDDSQLKAALVNASRATIQRLSSNGRQTFFGRSSAATVRRRYREREDHMFLNMWSSGVGCFGSVAAECPNRCRSLRCSSNCSFVSCQRRLPYA